MIYRICAAFLPILTIACATNLAGPSHFPERLAGLGTEPFWNITLDGDRIGFRSLEAPQEQVGRVSRRSEGDRLIVSGTISSRTVRAVFTPTQCSDGMSDRVHAYSLTLELGEDQLKGCAYRP